ncbi:DUF4817 domain-containing protein [Trichonephila clavipes]|nr:DUF4817 domain-containing protein [Trichonephila clavipes]
MTRFGPSFTPTTLGHEERVGLAKTESAITVQRAFRIKFGRQPPNDNNIRRWYPLFETTCCLCKGKSTERPMLSKESAVGLLQALKQTNLQMTSMPTIENVMDCVAFSDGSAFNLCEHADTHNARIWSLEDPHEVLELPRDSPKC